MENVDYFVGGVVSREQIYLGLGIRGRKIKDGDYEKKAEVLSCLYIEDYAVKAWDWLRSQVCPILGLDSVHLEWTVTNGVKWRLDDKDSGDFATWLQGDPLFLDHVIISAYNVEFQKVLLATAGNGGNGSNGLFSSITKRRN